MLATQAIFSWKAVTFSMKAALPGLVGFIKCTCFHLWPVCSAWRQRLSGSSFKRCVYKQLSGISSVQRAHVEHK